MKPPLALLLVLVCWGCIALPLYSAERIPSQREVVLQARIRKTAEADLEAQVKSELKTAPSQEKAAEKTPPSGSEKSTPAAETSVGNAGASVPVPPPSQTAPIIVAPASADKESSQEKPKQYFSPEEMMRQNMLNALKKDSEKTEANKLETDSKPNAAEAVKKGADGSVKPAVSKEQPAPQAPPTITSTGGAPEKPLKTGLSRLKKGKRAAAGQKSLAIMSKGAGRKGAKNLAASQNLSRKTRAGRRGALGAIVVSKLPASEAGLSKPKRPVKARTTQKIVKQRSEITPVEKKSEEPSSSGNTTETVTLQTEPQVPNESTAVKEGGAEEKDETEESDEAVRLFKVINKRLPPGVPETDEKADYYVDLGSDYGLKQGSYVDVYRKVQISDDINRGQSYQLVVRVGRLKAIQVQRQLSVMRIAEIFAESKDSPHVDVKSIMVGDIVMPLSKGLHIAHEMKAEDFEKLTKAAHKPVSEAGLTESSDAKSHAQQPAKTQIIEIRPPKKIKK